MEDLEFLNNAILINNTELYDEYGSCSYMVRAEWLMKKSNSYKEKKKFLTISKKKLEVQ